MSHQFYSSGITRCRLRSPWWDTFKTVVVLLALAALAGWLLSLVKQSAGISHSVTSGGVLLAMVPWQEGAVMGLLMFFTLALSAGFVIWAVRRVRQHEVEAELRWSAPGSCRPLNLPTDDLRRILSAVIAGICIANEHVRKAQKDLSIEDYGDKLKAAENEHEQIIQCLGELIRHLNVAEAAGGREPVKAKAATLNQEANGAA